jgi:hypothetical protein
LLATVSLLLALATGGRVHADGHEVVWLRAQDGHGRPFDLQRVRGQVVALTFASRYTRDEADRVHAALLNHAAEGDMVVVNVVDLMGIPGIFHGYARRKAAEHDREGRIIHVVDEEGELRRNFQVDPRKRVDILVLDREGTLRGRFAGAGQLEDAIRLVDQLRVSSAQLQPR